MEFLILTFLEFWMVMENMITMQVNLLEDINHPLIKKCEDAKEIYQKLILNRYKIIANLFIYRYSNPKRKI